MILSHEKLQGNLTGPLSLFKTQTERAEGIQGENMLSYSLFAQLNQPWTKKSSMHIIPE